MPHIERLACGLREVKILTGLTGFNSIGEDSRVEMEKGRRIMHEKHLLWSP